MRPSVEVEELPTQSLAPRAKSRVPITGAIAAATVVALLAGGFGLLGGRSAGTAETTPPASLVARQPTAVPSATEPPEPRVTPWTACSGSPDQPLETLLEIEGVQHRGDVELLDLDAGQAFLPDPTVISGDEQLDPIELSMEAITDIWIVGGACAVAWSIELVGSAVPGGTWTLEAVGNEDRDPAVSAQNRFQVFVAPYAGDHVLRAVLVFEDFAVQSTWSIRVPPLAAPPVTLTTALEEIPTAIGCDVTQRLANDVEVALSACDGDLQEAPAKRVEVAPGEVLEFAIAGWAANTRSVTCGLLVEHLFFPRNNPVCVRDQDPLFGGVRFPAPVELGPTTLAVSACALRIRVSGIGFDELCGTWYANVIVRD